MSKFPEFIDPNQVPKHAIMTSKHKNLPHFVPIHGFMCVSADVVNMIEALEPEVHQFIPVTVTRRPRYVSRSGENVGQVRFLFNIGTIIDSVFIEKSVIDTFVIGENTKVSRFVSDGRDSRIVLRRDVIRNLHAWRGRHHMPREIFFSNELVERLGVLDLRSLELSSIEEA